MRGVRFFERVLRGIVLRDYQVESAYQLANYSSRIVCFDTGLGKTPTVIAGILMRLNLSKSTRVLWVTPLVALPQTLRSLKRFTSLKVGVLTGSASSISKFLKTDISHTGVIIVNTEAFDNTEVLNIVSQLEFARVFDAVVIDEAHQVANPFKSNRNSYIYMLAYRSDFTVLMTATPIISNTIQYAALVALVTKDMLNLFGIRNRMHMGQYVPNKIPDIMSYKTRDSILSVEVRRFHTHVPNLSFPGVSIFSYTRGYKSVESLVLLKNIVTENEGKKFLIHCNLTEHHNVLKDYLNTIMGLTCGVISGQTKNISNVQRLFKEGVLDCVIFSIPLGLDLESDYIIMYDWTVFAVQAVGRGLRSNQTGKYKAYFIISDVEAEMKLCRNSVIKNGLLTEEALDTDILRLGGLI
jgi:superfamily II DNA or RNA helicase